jgi:hypothetical protein
MAEGDKVGVTGILQGIEEIEICRVAKADPATDLVDLVFQQMIESRRLPGLGGDPLDGRTVFEDRLDDPSAPCHGPC